MDIEDKYSDEDLQNAKEIIYMKLEEQGISSVMETLKEAQKEKGFWKRYDKDRDEEEKDSKQEQDSFEDEVIDAIFEAFNPKTEKMEDEKEEILRESSAELIKIFDIVKDNPSIQEEIAEHIYNLEYDQNDAETRMKVVKDVIATLSMTSSVEQDEQNKFDILYKALNDKIHQMNMLDFFTIYGNTVTQRFFRNPIFTDTVIEKMNNMSKEEFEYFLITTSDRMDGDNPQIIDAKKTITDKFNNPMVKEVYEKMTVFHHDDIDYCFKYVMDKVSSIFSGTVNKDKAIEIFKEFNPSELMRFMIMHQGISAHTATEPLLTSSVLGPKLKELDDTDIILLTELFYENYERFMLHGNDYGQKNSYSAIIDEAKRRNLLSQDNEKLYTKEENNKANELLSVYKNIDQTKYMPIKFLTFNTKISDNDKDFDSIDPDQVLLSRYNKLEQILKNNLELYATIEKVAQMSDLQILQEANRINTKIQKNQITEARKENEIQLYYFNYLKRKILSLPTGYAAFLQPIENGVLTDAMNVKIGEMQNCLRNKQQDENTNNTDTPDL